MTESKKKSISEEEIKTCLIQELEEYNTTSKVILRKNTWTKKIANIYYLNTTFIFQLG